MRVNRGDVVLVNMPFAQGGGAKVRPALVVQSDHNNARLTNTIIASITRNVGRAHEPTQLLIKVASPVGQQSGLLADSAVTCENLFTVEQSFIIRAIGRIQRAEMRKIDECLKFALGVP